MILSRGIRRRLRRLRQELSLLRHRRLWKPGTAPALKIVPAAAEESPFPHPAIRVVLPTSEKRDRVIRLLEAQSENSWTLDVNGAAPFLYCPEADAAEAAPVMLESLLLVAASCGLDCVTAAPGRDGQPANATLLRLPDDQPRPGLGRRLDPDSSGEAVPGPLETHQGWFHSRPDCREIVVRLHDAEKVLAALPLRPGPPTAIFVLPFVAVGGAEQLLYDLLVGWKGRYRILLVTLDEHRAELGWRLEGFAELGVHIYRLGDWLPREARIPALRHLIRRWSAGALISWNGSIDFYDHVEEIRRDFPSLRIYDQHYNHSGAWLEWLQPEITRGMFAQIAVNEKIGRALEDRGARRVELIHHAVRIPTLPAGVERHRLRDLRRRELGVSEDALLVGSFIRMHPQKRPMDIVRLARRMEGRGFVFLLVGGGPEEARVKEELNRRPVENLIHLPMQEETGSLFDALDLCLLMSEFEGLPVFLLEGMAREIPCLAPDVGEIRRLFSEGGGRLVDRPGHLMAFEEALEEFRNPDLRRDQGLRARARVVRDYGLEEYCRAYERLIFP